MTEDFGIRNEDPLRQQVKWLEFQATRPGIRSVPEIQTMLAVAKFTAEKIIERRKVEKIVA